jgi:hypothetical protein
MYLIQTLKSAAMVLGLGGGIFSATAGSALTAFTWFSGPIWHGLALQRDATVLLFLTIPLLMLGAHFLDLLDGAKVRANSN